MDHKCKFRSKKGLLPFIELNGEEIADSNMIIETLAKKFEKEMPAELSQDQKNVQHAMIAMVENHLHWWVQTTVPCFQYRAEHVITLYMIETDPMLYNILLTCSFDCQILGYRL